MSRRSALIIGIGGQDGSYLTEHLLAQGYSVFGLVRHTTAEVPERISHLRERVTLVRGDLVDQLSLIAAIERTRPNEIYNLAGTSFVPESWNAPATTAEDTGMGVVRLLEAIRLTDPAIRFYQASTSEIFGRPQSQPQDERTAYDPRNPYAVAKLYAHLMTERYREGFGLFAAAGILYNHESPRRGPEFVTRKITRAAAAISLGLETELRLGDVSARRDWGFAGDYAKAMWTMLQQPEPATFVVATGELHSVEEVARIAFSHAGLDVAEHVVTDEGLLRPDDDRAQLVGDSSRARDALGWAPTIALEDLIRLMVDADVARLEGSYGPHLDWPAAQVPLRS